MEPGCYAALAQVSPGYSPLEGRLATCYSPVRHFTHPDVLLHPSFLVRLACVRHAASVDSEPGSNSRLKSARTRTTSNGVRALMFIGALPEKSGKVPRPVPCRQNRTCRSAFVCTQPLQTLCIDVDCSTQLSKSYLIPLGRDPHCLGQAQLMFRRYSSGDFQPRAIIESTPQKRDCQGAFSKCSRKSRAATETSKLAAIIAAQKPMDLQSSATYWSCLPSRASLSHFTGSTAISEQISIPSPSR